MSSYHWNENVFILMKCSSLAALEVIKMTTASVASDENFVKMTTFSFEGYCTHVRWYQIEVWHHGNHFFLFYVLKWAMHNVCFYLCGNEWDSFKVILMSFWKKFSSHILKGVPVMPKKSVQIIKQKWNLNSAASTGFTCVADLNMNKTRSVSSCLDKI